MKKIKNFFTRKPVILVIGILGVGLIAYLAKDVLGPEMLLLTLLIGIGTGMLVSQLNNWSRAQIIFRLLGLIILLASTLRLLSLANLF